MNWRTLLVFLLAAFCIPAVAAPLDDHFLGPNPICAHRAVPVILVTDITRTGEIDDTISLHMYRRLEESGCIEIAAIVSIFGNGGAGAKQVHRNLLMRLDELDISDWLILRGPHSGVPFSRSKELSEADRHRLERIAAVARGHDRVVIAELGPFTVSARLLMHGMIEGWRVARILGVGGRAPGERFSTGKGIPFEFRDMNVAEDREAIEYLLEHHPEKLWLVTWRSGIGARMLDPEVIASGLGEPLGAHARKRAARLELIGYGGLLPAWDAWTTSFFLRGGPEKLGCATVYARMRYAEGFKPTDSMQLHLMQSPDAHTNAVTACHRLAGRE